MKAKTKLFQVVVVIALVFGTIYVPAMAASSVAAPSAGHGSDNSHDDGESVIFFTADGMRQDLARDLRRSTSDADHREVAALRG